MFRSEDESPDYVLGMVRQLSKFLGKAFGLLKEEQYPAALEEIRAARQAYLALPDPVIYNLPAEELLELFTVAGYLDVVKALTLVEMCKAEGDALTLQGFQSEGERAYLKGLDVLLGLFHLTGPTRFSPEITSVETFDGLIEQPLPFETQANLFVYYEEAGQLAQAAETLLELGETAFEEIREEGRAFFERLRELDEGALAAGRLARAEAAAFEAEFLEMGNSRP